MKHYQYICFPYQAPCGSFHFHYRTRKDMKHAMHLNCQPWDTFSYGKRIPHFGRLLKMRQIEVRALDDTLGEVGHKVIDEMRRREDEVIRQVNEEMRGRPRKG